MVQKGDTLTRKKVILNDAATSNNCSYLVVRTTSRRCSSRSPPTPTPTPTPTELFALISVPRCLSDVCWPTVFLEKQQLDAFVSANGVGGESFCCPPPASFELVSAGTFANSGETPFCKLGYSNSRRLFRPPGPPAAALEVGNITRAINIFIMATNTITHIKQCPACSFFVR